MQALQKTDNEIKIQSMAEKAIEKANSMVIDSEANLTLATDVLKFIKDKIKQAETERKAIVAPFNDGVKAINGRFKTITEPLEKAENDLKRKMLVFQQDLEKKRREEEEAKRKELEEYAKSIAEQAKESGDTETAKEITKQVNIAMNKPIEIEKVRGSTGALSTIRKTWAYEVVDIKALAAARPDLVQENGVAIRKELGEGVEIAGLRIYQTESLSIR
jgi:hypothetical protein